MTEGKIEFIFKETYGYRLRGTVEEWDETLNVWSVIDISSFTTKQFRIRKPNGITVTVPADFETNGTDGVLIYIIPSGSTLLDQVGFYDWQAILANTTQYFPTEIQGFKIDDPI